MEDSKVFEARKQDHLRLALAPEMQARAFSDLSQIELIHEALPEIDFSEVDITTEVFGRKVAAPIFVSSMTAGHTGSLNLNRILAEICERRNWAMAVGSQRRELTDLSAAQEWKDIRRSFSKVILFGNIGISQLIRCEVSDIERLVDNLEASAMFVHLNPLQECLQPEGTPHFSGSFEALTKLCKSLSVPVIIKETGCGFSAKTLEKLSQISVAVVDVSGLGGTHWGRIEGGRGDAKSVRANAAKAFDNWGIGTVSSTFAALEMPTKFSVWASGGVRSGVDVAKLIAVGAKMVGIAQPILEAALQSGDELNKVMETFEFQLKTAMFCTGTKNLSELHNNSVWKLQF